jgi:hypothetical protein
VKTAFDEHAGQDRGADRLLPPAFPDHERMRAQSSRVRVKPRLARERNTQ